MMDFAANPAPRLAKGGCLLAREGLHKRSGKKALVKFAILASSWPFTGGNHPFEG